MKSQENVRPAVSFIVPVYKSEKYISACLDSILAQTFRDFEVILIDDGSPDRAGAICDAYAKKDTRIRVFHQENRSVGQTRQKGLDLSRGDYIFWVDSDDYIKEYLLEKALKQFHETDADIVVYELSKVMYQEITATEHLPDCKTLPDWQKAAATGKLTRVVTAASKKALWNKIKIPEQVSHAAEDGYLCAQLFMNAKSVSAVPEVLYYYRRENTESITHQQTGKGYFGGAWNWNHRLQLCKTYFPDREEWCAQRALDAVVRAHCMSLVFSDITVDDKHQLKSMLSGLSKYRLPWRVRDNLLRWAIRHNWMWPCRLYANHKIAKDAKKNLAIEQHRYAKKER